MKQNPGGMYTVPVPCPYPWGLERIICRQMDGQEENASLVGTVLQAHEGGLPVEQIISHRSCRAMGRRVPLQAS